MYSKNFPLAVLAVLLAGCNPSTSATGSSDSSAGPTTAVVKRQDLVGYSFFDGKLVIPTTAEAVAYSAYDTPVVSVSTGVGKYVERGEPIVKLNIPGADQAASVATINASSANSNLSDQKNLASAPVQAAKQALDAARASEKEANDTVAAGGTADVAAATQARVDAETALRDAQQTMAQTVQPAKDAAASSAAQLQAIKADAAQGIVRAPISGTVITLDAKPGMDAKAQQNLATIVNFGAARVQGIVPPELKDVVVRHSHVIIAMNGANSDPIDGRVRDVTVLPPTAGQTSAGYLAVIEFTNPRAIAQTNLVVKRIGIETGKVKQAMVVPLGAVSTKDGASTVGVQKGDQWVSTVVTTGISDGAQIEIKSGLSEGDVVRVSGS